MKLSGRLHARRYDAGGRSGRGSTKGQKGWNVRDRRGGLEHDGQLLTVASIRYLS